MRAVPDPRPAPAPFPDRGGTLRLDELVAALSYALDLTEGQPPGHGVRCGWIGLHLGRAIGLAEADLPDLAHVLLLKDLGCSSNAARICELYLTDDLTFKRDYKRVGDSLAQVLRFVVSHTGPATGLAERFQAVLHVVRNGGEIARELIETRCQRGADIARRMRFSEAVARGIRDLDEHWDGSGRPSGLMGPGISLYARIALLAQVVDVMHGTGGREAALREVRLRSGTWFDPALAAAFEAVARDPGLWAALEAGDARGAFLAILPEDGARSLDEDYLDDIAEGFAQVIDAKSPYTSGHSQRVAVFADLIARELGVEPGRRRWLRRAALLHDIGKLGVSSRILDKPGRLDGDEWSAMKGHAAASETILGRIGAFAELAEVVGAHHERLDGGGYPRGLAGEAIRLETRIISAADVFDALTAERPYRGPMPVAQALATMRESVGSALDPSCFEALARAVAGVEREVA